MLNVQYNNVFLVFYRVVLEVLGSTLCSQDAGSPTDHILSHGRVVRVPLLRGAARLIFLCYFHQFGDSQLPLSIYRGKSYM